MDGDNKVVALWTEFKSLVEAAELDVVKNSEISDLECEMVAQWDPVLKNLISSISLLKMDQQSASAAPMPEDKSRQEKDAEKRQIELAQLQKNYSERIEQFRNEIRRDRQSAVEKDIKRVEAAIDIATKQQRANENDADRLRKLAEQFGFSSVDVEMLRSEIAIREKTLDSIAAEREKLKVELRAPSRVIQLQKKAEVPTAKSHLFWFF